MYGIIKTALEIQVPFNMIIVCTAFVMMTLAIGAIAKEVRLFAAHRMDLDIKREMLEQGSSAEEIERVLQVGGERMNR